MNRVIQKISPWNDPNQTSRQSFAIHSLLERESRKSDGIKSSFHAACLVYKKRIVGVGINKRKSHPMMTRHSPRRGQIYLHAEVDAIIKVINNFGVEILSECSLYVLRTTKTGIIASSKPCEGCQGHINHFGIKEVFWTP